MRRFRCALLAASFTTLALLPALAGGTDSRDQLFTNQTSRPELQAYSGTPVWELLAGCSGFANAASEYYRGNGMAEDHKRWAALSLETYSTAQGQLLKDRTLDEESARPLLNAAFELRRTATATALQAINPKQPTPAMFAAETDLLRGTQTRLCIAAAMEAGDQP